MGTFSDELHEERERERQSNERIRKAPEPVQSGEKVILRLSPEELSQLIKKIIKSDG